MHLFYTPDISGPLYTFSEEESKHCVRVLRLEEGAEVWLTDGKGKMAKAVLRSAQPKKCTAEIIEVTEEYGKRDYYLHIAVAPTKQIERFEWFLEKATEIGIDEITPVICKRSERREVKIPRLDKVITAAMKQSLKAYHPKLNEACTFGELVEQHTAKKALIAHCGEGEKRSMQSIGKSKDLLVLIGPEGDFTADEVNLALQKGFEPISLGASRLRTETAALAPCFYLHFLNA